MSDDKKITVIGAGISGLATAFWLHRDGFEVTVLERNSAPGGTMETVTKGGFLFDRGPNSGLETTPYIRMLAEAAGIEGEMIYADAEANKRYILRNNTLHPLPTSPPAFISSKLFSSGAKLRLLREPFIGRSKEGYYQSLAEFVERRLGREFLDYAINPFVSGVFAGRPEELSVKSAFPKLYRLEEKYGGLLKGMVLGARERRKSAETSKQSARMFSFRQGMQVFPQALAGQLGPGVIYNAGIEKIVRSGNKYIVHYSQGGEHKHIDSDAVITTIPSYILAGIVRDMDDKLHEHLASIYYPPVLVAYTGYKRSAIGQPLDGFGFLIPEKENKSFLGAIWSSTLFPGRSPENHASFTLFIGGARSPGLAGENIEQLLDKSLKEFQEIMKIDDKPVFLETRMWEKAIPQYKPGHVEHVTYFEAFERANPGFFISGNFRDGISVGDCVKNSDITFKKVKSYISGDNPA
ncbi:protoporphyrinogen oxidase [candidate division KSB1 bacterium]